MSLYCLIGCTLKIVSVAVILLISILGLMYVVLKNSKTIQEKWFSRIFVMISKNMTIKFAPFKEKLFQDLSKVVSKDPELQKNGAFRILEIGAGDGANLKYYPNNCRLISLEPNDYFSKYYEKNKAIYPDLVIEKFCKGVAENMKDIPDDSVDVVVCTHVLCSVMDMDLVLKEVKRVLCKGGQFLLLEHVAAPMDTWTFKIQQLVEPVWSVFFAGCRLTCITKKKIEDAGFSQVEVEPFSAEMPPLLKYQIFGRALK